MTPRPPPIPMKSYTCYFTWLLLMHWREATVATRRHEVALTRRACYVFRRVIWS